MTVNLTTFSFLDPGRAMKEIEAAINTAIADKFPEAPNDGKLYGRMRSTWTAASGLQGPAGPAGPAGPQGAEGPAGPMGPQGDVGPAGTQGPQGDTGTQGPIGLTGPTGAQGPKGDTGAAGAVGQTGQTGPAGATGPQGPQGLIGPAGPQGNTGGVGAQGPAGPTNVSADAGNLAKLGTDNLLLVPDTAVHKGVTDGSNAIAGNIGEQLAASVTVAVSLTTAVAANIATLALSAGDWSVSGVVVFAEGANTIPTALAAGLSAASAALPTAAQVAAGVGNLTQYNLTFPKGFTQTMQAGICRVSISAAANVYLVAQSTFSGGTLTATGYISARRVR